MTKIMHADTTEETAEHPIPKVRHGLDAKNSAALRRDPSNEDAKLDIALDESFPSSDAPSNTQPGKGKDPVPSSGYDPKRDG